MSPTITLIIADDHPLFRAGLCEVIGTDPDIHIAGIAGDGVAALDLIRQHAPDTAILDIDMPKMSGLEVARQLQQEQRETDVIFLTLYKEEDLFNEAMDTGARGYVLKDSAANEILHAIHRVAEGKYYLSPAVSTYLMARSARVEKLLRHSPSLEDLTGAELRILRLIALGKTSKEIAEVLSISHKTVENHRTNIASKLGLRGSHSLLKFALENRKELE